MSEKRKQANAEKQAAKSPPTELKDEQLDQAQGGLSVEQSGKDDTRKQGGSAHQEGRAIGDNLVSVEAEG